MKKMLFFFVFLVSIFSQDIQLPEPLISENLKLFDAYKNRQTSREFKDIDISLQEISNILWCGHGINRPEGGKRTAPSTHGKNEIDVYVFLKTGVYIHNVMTNTLVQVFKDDIRELAGLQDFVKNAPVTFLFIADMSKLGKDKTANLPVAYADATFISQNIYLYCAVNNFATGVRAYIDRKTLAQKLKLNPEFEIILAQSISHK